MEELIRRSSIPYPLSLSQAQTACSGSFLFRQFPIPAVSCSGSFLFRQFIAPAVYCSGSLLKKLIVQTCCTD